jgi:hypothetical protein
MIMIVVDEGVFDHAQHRAGVGKELTGIAPVAANEIFSGRHAFQRQQQVVLVGRECEPSSSDTTLFRSALDDGVEVLHAVELSVAHRVEQRLAFTSPTSMYSRVRGLDRRISTAAIAPCRQRAESDVAKRCSGRFGPTRC